MAVAGKLAAIMTLDGEPFLKNLKKVQEQANGFAADLTNLPNLAGKSLSGFSAAFTGSIATATRSFSTLTMGIANIAKLVPGGAGLAAVIADPINAANEAAERTHRLARESAQLGVGPSFLRAIQLAAGPDADLATNALRRILRLQGEVKVGSEELMGAGQATAAGKLARYGLLNDVGQDSEGFIRSVVARGHAMTDAAERMKFAFDVAGKGGVGLLELFEKGPQALDKWVDKLKELGAYTDQQVATARAWLAAEKEIKLVQEAYQQKTLGITSTISLGASAFKGGDIGKGLGYMFLGGANLISKSLGITADYQWTPPEISEILRKQARDKMREEASIRTSGVGLEDAKKLFEQNAHWREMASLVGKTAEQAALYKLRTDFPASKARDETEKWLKLSFALKDFNDELQKAQQISEKLFQQTRDPLDKMKTTFLEAAQAEHTARFSDQGMRFNFDERNIVRNQVADRLRQQAFGQFEQLERSLGLGAGRAPVRLAPAMLAGSREAFSSIAYAGSQQTGPQSIPDRLQAVLQELQRRGQEADRNAKDLLKAIQDQGGFGIANN